ncbi:MAG: Smr/MutS family protein [Bacteroides sp.]|nr:Smr/MutS family protein [Prevotella sp.]MCM1407515.1 Smr/MutS family protein [Treponema brennaborense]MCM1470005.1 Smr/MutS family protein [Bacteroides sp.]
MNKTILEQLDYFRVLEEIAGYCLSEDARNRLLCRFPSADAAQISSRKIAAAEWMRYASAVQKMAFPGWRPLEQLFPLLAANGAALSLEEAYCLGCFCRSVHAAQNMLCSQIQIKHQLTLPCLEQTAALLPDLSEAEDLIFSVVDSSGELRELPEIRAAKKSIQKIRRDIEHLLHAYTADLSLRDALQSAVPVLRGGRQVLAVKAQHRQRIKGIVHEISQTGQTFYIEPADIVRRNNELAQAEAELAQTIRRIFRELTARLCAFREFFVSAHDIMCDLDCSYAAAKWGLAHRCVCAQDCTDAQTPALIHARHPLLGERAVPVDVCFPPECRVLIISGPNAGGKTAAMKTIALFALLNQSGFPVPADEGTRLPVFSSVFADIGDEQSLDQSLSTFSAHMKNLAEAARGADENSLVLLDELGSGTDPQEGGALAMAALDFLLEKKAFVLATTHHGILKNYGAERKFCVNASVEFDKNALSPTYRVLMGVPGESHALDIARRSGLPEKIIADACDYAAGSQTDAAVLIQNLTEKHAALIAQERELCEKEKIADEKLRTAELKTLRARQHEAELRENGYRKAKQFVDENRRMLENLVRELREGEITREKTLRVKEVIAEMSAAVDEEKRVLETEKNALAALASENETAAASSGRREKNAPLPESVPEKFAKDHDFLPGAEVFAGTSRCRGTVLGRAKNGRYFVRVGSMKMTFAANELSAAPPANAGNTPCVSVEFAANGSAGGTFSARNNAFAADAVAGGETPAFELRLLGMRYEAAMKSLEHQMDLCAVHNFKSFSVIHGKGSGALQSGVHELLKMNPAVLEFHFARPEDGGTGKTYVTLR